MSLFEIWLPIKGYEGLYEISNLGRVKSLPKVRGRAVTGEKILKSHVVNGYEMVMLCRNYKTFNASVHRLVARAFIPNPKNKPHINHIDGNKANNSIENLEWCTPSENMIHAYRTGLKTPESCARYGKRRHRTNEEKKRISEGTKKAMYRSDVQAKLHAHERRSYNEFIPRLRSD